MRSSLRRDCLQNGKIFSKPKNEGQSRPTSSSVKRFGRLVVAGFSPRPGIGQSDRYEVLLAAGLFTKWSNFCEAKERGLQPRDYELGKTFRQARSRGLQPAPRNWAI